MSKPSVGKRECRQCHEAFEPSSPYEFICSDTCRLIRKRSRAAPLRTTKVCPECDESFDAAVSKSKFSKITCGKPECVQSYRVKSSRAATAKWKTSDRGKLAKSVYTLPEKSREKKRARKKTPRYRAQAREYANRPEIRERQRSRYRERYHTEPGFKRAQFDKWNRMNRAKKVDLQTEAILLKQVISQKLKEKA